MPSQGANNPGSSDNEDNGGIAWSNVDQIFSSNDSYATYDSVSEDNSDYLNASSCDFTIPDGATIDGILVEIEAKRAGFGAATFDNVQLLKGGSRTGTPKTSAIDETEAYISFGGAADLWGATLSAADVNDSGFGVSIRAANTELFTATVSVDHVRITVHYTEAGGGGVVVAATYVVRSDDRVLAEE
jgi:hypothetical protein